MINIFNTSISLPALIIIILIIISGLVPPPLNFTIYESEYGYFRVLDFTYIFAGIITLIFCLNNKIRISKTWICLFLATGIVTLLNTSTDIDSNALLFTWLTFIMTTAIAIYQPNSNEARHILQVVIIVCSLNIIFGFLIFILGDIIVSYIAPNYYSTHRLIQPFCIFGGPIILAFLCLVTMAVSSLLWMDRFPKFIALSNSILLALSVCWASRSGFLAVLIAFIILYWKSSKKFLLLPAAGVLLASIILSTSYIKEETRFTVWNFSDKSSLWRYNAILYLGGKIKENYLLGSGPGVIFSRIDRDKFADFFTKSNVPLIVRDGYIMPTEPHNTYLLFFLEYGIFGISVFLIFIVLSLRRSSDFEIVFGKKNYYQLIFAVLFIIYGLTETLMYNLRFSVLLWSCLTVLHLKTYRKTSSPGHLVVL